LLVVAVEVMGIQVLMVGLAVLADTEQMFLDSHLVGALPLKRHFL